MGLGDFFEGVGDAVTNVAKGAAWVARPDHWDDIAKGAGKAVEFVAENPGKTWDTAFEVGRAVVKDQLDPVNLAINAGLLAATVATGGAAAPAFIAKLGMGAKSLEAGVAAAKGIDTAVDVAKGVSTGVKAVEAGTSALKAADTAADVGRAVKTVDTAVDTAKTGSRVMRGVDKALGLEPGRVGKGVSNVLNPLENSRFGMQAMRDRGAAKMLEAGGEAPGLARQVGAAVLQGTGRGAGGPAQLAGMSDKVYAAQKMAARAGAVGKRAHQLDQFGQGVEVAADPMGYATEKAYEEADRQGIGRDAGYTDRGHTTESLYGNAREQLAIGPSTRQSAFTAGTGQLAIEAGSQVGASPYANTATSASGAGGAPPSSTSTMASATPSEPGKKRMEGWSKPGTVQNPPVQKGGWKPSGQHFWEGPRSQWAGGVQSNYDWRKIDPLRPISAPSTRQAGRYKQAVKDRGKATTEAGQPTDESSTMTTATPSGNATAPGTAVERTGDLNEQGAPANFSPEVPKSGMYAMSAGQQPPGSAVPMTRMGEGGRTRHHTATTLSQPIGAIGPGRDTGNAVIDADSSSPDDFKFDNSGQGYFDFGNTMGTAAVGEQPNTSPMYSQGSRTSRRSAGMLGV